MYLSMKEREGRETVKREVFLFECVFAERNERECIIKGREKRDNEKETARGKSQIGRKKHRNNETHRRE